MSPHLSTSQLDLFSVPAPSLTLEQRRKALEWSYERLSRESGVKLDTVYAVVKRFGRGEPNNITKISAALDRGERGGAGAPKVYANSKIKAGPIWDDADAPYDKRSKRFQQMDDAFGAAMDRHAKGMRF